MLGLLWRLPQNVFQRDIRQDALDELHVSAAVGAVDADVSAFAGFGDDLKLPACNSLLIIRIHLAGLMRMPSSLEPTSESTL